MKKLRVADLFCGAGGISVGFEMANCEVVFGLDKVSAAVETFKNNHLKAQTVQADASDFNWDSIPEFDILVGGPPCINFSMSKGGNANVLEGLRLVQAFLKVVYERKPKYWIMENVPRIALHLPDEIPLKWIGIDKKGVLHVPRRHEFNAANYGTPQNRKRYLIGNYEMPIKTHYDPSAKSIPHNAKHLEPWLTLEHVLSNLPSPYLKNKPDSVTDPNYGFNLDTKFLTEQFQAVEMTAEEIKKIRKAKTEHPFMGRMKFPDDITRPARTVVATQMGRETLVIMEQIDKKVIYRRATVRECSAIQSFPISFQYFGNNLNARYKLAGDSGPPKLSYAIAKEIVKKEQKKKIKYPHVQEKPIELSAPVQLVKRKKSTRPMAISKRFRFVIPGKEIRGCRVRCRLL